MRESGRVCLYVCMCPYLHEFLFSALRTDDVLGVRDEALADQRGAALRADEAVVVPVAVLERDEACAAYTYGL